MARLVEIFIGFLGVLEIILSFTLYTYFLLLLRSYIHKINTKYKGSPPRQPFNRQPSTNRTPSPATKKSDKSKSGDIGSAGSSPSKSSKRRAESDTDVVDLAPEKQRKRFKKLMRQRTMTMGDIPGTDELTKDVESWGERRSRPRSQSHPDARSTRSHADTFRTPRAVDATRGAFTDMSEEQELIDLEEEQEHDEWQNPTSGRASWRNRASVESWRSAEDPVGWAVGASARSYVNESQTEVGLGELVMDVETDRSNCKSRSFRRPGTQTVDSARTTHRSERSTARIDELELESLSDEIY
eukprot:232044_1